MKISKTTQQRTIIFATAAALIALFLIAQLSVQLLYSTTSFHVFVNHLPNFFREMSIQVLCPF